MLAVAAFLSVYQYLKIEAPLTWVGPLGTIFILLGLIYYFISRQEVTEQALSAKPTILFIAGALGVFYAFWLILPALFPGALDLHHEGEIFISPFPGVFDLHHEGEIFTSALDFINGGYPFLTYFWPHGLHDTGMVALAFKTLSMVDTPTMFIGWAFSLSFGAVTILLIAYGFGMGYYSIFAMASLLLFNKSINPAPFAQLLFVIPAFLFYAQGTRWFSFCLSGILIFVAHIYRIEAGVYGAMSIVGLASLQLFASVISRDIVSLKLRAKNFTLFLVAVLISMGLAYILLGWPGPEWYRIAFGTLPKYMADSAGFPFPLPIDTDNYLLGLETARFTTVYYCSVIGLLSIATVVVARRITALKPSDYFFILIVLLSVVSLRTAFGRSDAFHIHQYANLAFLVLLLCLARGVVRSGLVVWQKVAVVSLVFVFFNFVTGSFTNTPFLGHGRVVKNSFQFLSDYSKDRPAQCSEAMFSEVQLSLPYYREYDRAICDIKKLLSMLNIRSGELLVSHSASLVYPSLGFKPPTRYYCLGWAITDDMQRELIADLEGSKVKVILFINEKFNGISTYDIPDKVRLPIYYKWLEKNFDLSSGLSTPLGILAFSRSLGIDFSKPFYTQQR